MRRYVRDAGDLLDELIELTRCDCTTRNERKAAAAGARAWTSSRRASPSCAAQEELTAIRPDLDGNAGDGPPRRRRRARSSGEALAFLLELRLEEGPLGEEEAGRRLDAWWAAPAGSPSPPASR